MNHHGKTYVESKEIAKRYRTWLSNFKKVEEHNARFNMGLETFTLGMEGQHADKTNEEYRNFVLGFRKRSGASGAIETFDSNRIQDIPESWSWVDHGVITKVKDQGDCGSYVYFVFLHKRKKNSRPLKQMLGLLRDSSNGSSVQQEEQRKYPERMYRCVW
jgi:C1A family cysteine protease